MSVVDEIKARIDIVDLVSESVKLRHSGKNYTGFCPFHANTHTPAFAVFPDSGTWRCFGQCNEGGDVFKFVMKKEGWDFPEALRYLAQKAGVELEPQTPEKRAEEDTHERLRTLLEEAVTFYRHQLLNTPAGKQALDYLTGRGLTPETIETFGLGYAPKSWDATLQYFTSRDYSTADLMNVGLITERSEGNGYYDRFRNRVMFPIRDLTGAMSGFGARILDPDDVPKFLNSPQTALFDKGRLLYALDQARKPIRAQDQVVIVEGYLDAIVLHQAGFTNTVSPMGTALSEDQLRMLKRYTRRIVLALDADAAGEKATLRGLEVARQAMDREGEVAFDARGLMRVEARLSADVRVTTIPDGMDPDEVVLRDPQEWQRILEQAQPVVIHVMETLAARNDIEDPKVKSEVAHQVLPLIEDVPDSIEREAYRQRLARLLRVDERSLMGGGSSARPKQRSRRRESPGVVKQQTDLLRDPKRRARGLERLILQLLIRQADALYNLDRILQQAGLARFTGQDFEQADHQILVGLLQQSLEQDQLDWQEFIHSNVDGTLSALLEELEAPMLLGEPNPQRFMEDLTRAVVQLRIYRLNENIAQLRVLQEELQEQGEGKLTPYTQYMVPYTQTLQRLNHVAAHPIQID
jgi:DNA primase